MNHPLKPIKNISFFFFFQT
uniref:Uncharacterized protein n=1 Tax=Rhizophora mucronata TaxID=61149 RepID=A0A2P2R104_RHIMU